MKSSIIIPCYNRKKLLLRCLKSLEALQTDKSEFEVIIIDDGSEDLSYEDLKEFQINLHYSRYERKEESGAALARNRGIAHSAGDLLIFLDCDQIVEPDFVEKHVQFNRDHNNGSGLLQIGTRKNLYPGSPPVMIRNKKYRQDYRKRIFESYQSEQSGLSAIWTLVFSHNISINRECVDQFGGFDSHFRGWGLEDQEFGYRMVKNGVKIRYNSEIEAYHQFHRPAYGPEVYKKYLDNLRYFQSVHDEKAVDILNCIDYSVILGAGNIKPGMDQIDDMLVQFYHDAEKAARKG